MGNARDYVPFKVPSEKKEDLRGFLNLLEES